MKQKAKAKPRTKARSAARAPGPRADFGAPVGGFFAKQPAAIASILTELRGLVEKAAPDATAALKWGMPFYTIDGNTLCGLGAHRSHVNLVLPGPPGTYADPDGLLEGEGKTGRRLKLQPGDALPRAAIARWLATAAARARKG